MRFLVVLLATCFAPGAVHGEAIDGPGPGTIRVHGTDQFERPRAARGRDGDSPRPERGPAPSKPDAPFAFTVPPSRVIVKVSDPALRPDNATSAGQNYFNLERRDPQLILSGKFWESERRSPAYAAPFAPTRVEMLRDGP
jgi:hypothetical protein